MIIVLSDHAASFLTRIYNRGRIIIILSDHAA